MSELLSVLHCTRSNLFKSYRYSEYFSWKTDEEMGRQVLHGISPLAFARCFEVPEHCNLSDSYLKGVLPKGKTLSSEIEVSLVEGLQKYGNLQST